MPPWRRIVSMALLSALIGTGIFPSYHYSRIPGMLFDAEKNLPAYRRALSSDWLILLKKKKKSVIVIGT